MPLPLIPLFIAGVTAASAALAGKKGYDSIQNIKETKEIAEQLENEYKHALEEFETQREDTNDTLETYGKLKLEILDGSMKEFVESFKVIKNVEFTDHKITDEFIKHSEVDQFILAVEKQVVRAGQMLTAGLASLAGGGLAAMGAVGATTTFAAASTGTAIAALSGIAAKNATLAFLGGGSLSAGGLGIAGGTMVLGGIALAPALALGSLIFAFSTQKKREEMVAKKAEVQTEIEKLISATLVMAQIQITTKSMSELVEQAAELLTIQTKEMERVISESGTNYSNYYEKEQTIIFTNYKLAVIVKDLLNSTILDEEGQLAENLQAAMGSGKQELDQLEAS